MTRCALPLGLASLLILSGCATLRASDPPLTEAEILRFIDAYDRMWEGEKDVVGLEAALDSGYVYFNSRGQVRSRERILGLASNASYRIENQRQLSDREPTPHRNQTSDL